MTTDELREPPNDQPGVAAPRRGAEDAAFLRAHRGGDPTAFASLYDRWFDRVYDVAYRLVWDHAAAADVAQDAFLTAWQRLDSLTDDDAFGGWLLRIARNRALDHQRRINRSTAVDDARLATYERIGAVSPTAPAGFAAETRLREAGDVAQTVEDDEIVDLLWSSARALGDRDLEVLNLSLRHGMTPAEVGDVLGVNRNAANQLVHRVKKRLATAVQARVLWTRDVPACEGLADALDRAGVAAFGPEAIRVVEKHVATCNDCSERRTMRLDPAALFAAVPIITLPALKAKVAAALTAAGVPAEAVPSGPAQPTEAPQGARHTRLEHRRRARRIATMVGAGVALTGVIVIVSIAALASRVDNDDLPRTSAVRSATSTTAREASSTSIATTSSTRRTSTTRVVTSATSLPSTATTVVVTTAPSTVAPPPPTNPTTTTTSAPTTTTTTTPPAPAATLSISRSTVALPGYVMQGPDAPQLSWTVANVASVSLAGPNLEAATASGTTPVCPGALGPRYCTLTLGTFVYTLTGFDPNGAAVIERSVTITVTNG